MDKFVFILQVLDELKKFYLSRDKIGYLCANMFEFNVIVATIKISFLERPSSRAVSRLMFVLAFRNHELKAICLFIIEFETNFITCLLKGLANGLTGKHLCVKGL